MRVPTTDPAAVAAAAVDPLVLRAFVERTSGDIELLCSATAHDRQARGDVVRRLVADIQGNAAVAGRVPADVADRLRQRVGPHYADHIRQLEVEASRRMAGAAGSPAAAAGDFAARAYRRLDDLFQRLDFSACDRFVMVGCGPLPVTLLHVCARTRVKALIGVDADPSTLGLALQLVDRDRVQLENHLGERYDYGAADVVYVANLVTPKRQVLARIGATVRPGARVVLRDPTAAGRLLAEVGVDLLPDTLRLDGAGPECESFLSRHVYLRAVGSTGAPAGGAC